MRYWIRKSAFLLGLSVFFVMLLSSLMGLDPFNPVYLISAIVKAVFGGALFWFAGFILGDIILKGVLEDLDINDKYDEINGGLVQRIHDEKERYVPGGPELPFVEERVSYQRLGKKAKK